MSLTRKLLKELELTDTAIERIIAAHVDTVDSLKQERDAALTRAAQTEASIQERDELRALAQTHELAAVSARDELTAYRSHIEAEQRATARRAVLADALISHGANPQALPLLLDAIKLPEEAWQGDQLADAAAVLQPWRAKYNALFTVKSPFPIMKVSPPVSGGGLLTPSDVKRMSASDINRNWGAVRTALQNN